jgi:hypothetical protein
MHRARYGLGVDDCHQNSAHPKLLLLLLHSSGGILLKCSVRNLKTAYGADSDIKDDQAQECGHESHEKTCQGVRTR